MESSISNTWREMSNPLRCTSSRKPSYPQMHIRSSTDDDWRIDSLQLAIESELTT